VGDEGKPHEDHRQHKKIIIQPLPLEPLRQVWPLCHLQSHIHMYTQCFPISDLVSLHKCYTKVLAEHLLKRQDMFTSDPAAAKEETSVGNICKHLCAGLSSSHIFSVDKGTKLPAATCSSSPYVPFFASHNASAAPAVCAAARSTDWTGHSMAGWRAEQSSAVQLHGGCMLIAHQPWCAGSRLPPQICRSTVLFRTAQQYCQCCCESC
jgi:hypothetical protein